MTTNLPPLRTELDVFPSPDPEQPGYVLRDPFQYTDVIAIVPPVLASVLPYFDGEHTEADIRTFLTRLTGEVDLGEVVQAFVESLSSAGFLQTEAFARMRDEAHDEFAREPERLPAHSGSAYPEDPDALRDRLREYMSGARRMDGGFGDLPGPGGQGIHGAEPPLRSGLVDATGRSLAPTMASGLVDLSGAPISSGAPPGEDGSGVGSGGPGSGGPGAGSVGAGGLSAGGPGTGGVGGTLANLLGIAAPHVSPEGGWRSYASAYGVLGPHLADRTFVILGTSHYGESERFGLTRKGYRTPLGLTRTDVDLVDALEREAPDSVWMEDYCHAIEHSIEFQVIFLQHLVSPNVKVLPILCGPFHEALVEGTRPEANPQVGAFLDALGRIAESRGTDLFWVLGIDLAHIGARYGDPIDMVADKGPMAEVRARDLARLDRVSQADREGFLGLVQPNQDELKWCGFSPLYTFLGVVPGARGDLWRYEQWNIDEASVVSFAAMGFS
jgi:AmmeMemoRadiSam system protein B